MLLALFGFPGGVELLVIVFVSLLLFSPLVALVYLVLFREEVEEADDERLADLEAEVADLRERLEEAAGGDENGASAHDETHAPRDESTAEE